MLLSAAGAPKAIEDVVSSIVGAERLRTPSQNAKVRSDLAAACLANALRGDVSSETGLGRLVAEAQPQSASNPTHYNARADYQEYFKGALRTYYAQTGQVPTPAIAALIGYTPANGPVGNGSPTRPTLPGNQYVIPTQASTFGLDLGTDKGKIILILLAIVGIYLIAKSQSGAA